MSPSRSLLPPTNAHPRGPRAPAGEPRERVRGPAMVGQLVPRRESPEGEPFRGGHVPVGPRDEGPPRADEIMEDEGPRGPLPAEGLDETELRGLPDAAHLLLQDP